MQHDPNQISVIKRFNRATYMYLPEHQHQQLSRQFHLLKAESESESESEYSEEFEKNRHFYP